MKLNKNTANVLLNLLNGSNSSTAISQNIQSVDVRSIQRSLASLVESGIINKHGSANKPTYTIN